jgi:hypothetical protein
MTKSPCIGCEFELADKNNPTCRECDRRVEYVASIEGGGGDIMEEIEKTEVRDQRSEIGDQGAEKVNRPLGKMCIIDGCDKKVVARGLCDTHYTAWQDGRIMHPTEGVYKKIRFSKARAAKSKPAQSKKTPVKKISAIKTPPEKIKSPRLDAVVVVDLNDYPRIKHQIDFLADKYLVNSEHAIIGLLGEALAGRRERSDHE